MKYPITFIAGLVLLAAQGATRAQIYETTDAEGNPVFTDTPVDASSSEVEMRDTNISDAPPPATGDGASATPAGDKAPAITDRTKTFPDPNAELYEERERRVREQAWRDSSTPHEVGDGEAPHEMEGGAAPRETEDGAAPRETEGGAAPRETEDGAAPHETMDGSTPREAGDL